MSYDLDCQKLCLLWQVEMLRKPCLSKRSTAKIREKKGKKNITRYKLACKDKYRFFFLLLLKKIAFPKIVHPSH